MPSAEGSNQAVHLVLIGSSLLTLFGDINRQRLTG